MISVIICTHNPRPNYMRRVLDALEAQTLPKKQWELLLIDNASEESLAKNWNFSWHPSCHCVRENQLGLTEARLRGITEAQGDLLVFIDDDNVLMPDYLEQVVAIQKTHPHICVFGAGVLEPEFEVEPEKVVRPRLFMLALRNVNQALWTNHLEDWFCLPFGAGLCVPRQIARRYFELVPGLGISKVMGRRGINLFCGEDDLFSWLSAGKHTGFGIFPELRITHLIPARRVQQAYLVQLVYGHSYSHTILSYMFRLGSPSIASIGRRLGLAVHGLKNGWFSMRCRQAELRGSADAIRFIKDNKLEPLSPGQNPLLKTGCHWTIPN